MSAPVLAIVPRLAFPPTTPFTSHVMACPAARQNDAVNVCVCPRPTFIVPGKIEFDAAQVTVTLALPDLAASATLVAVTLTVAGDGSVTGAVYTAVVAPFGAIVPTVAFPPETAFTLQVTPVAALPVPVTLAVNT